MLVCLNGADKAPATTELRLWGLHRKWTRRRMDKEVAGGEEEEQKHVYLGRGEVSGGQNVRVDDSVKPV